MLFKSVQKIMAITLLFSATAYAAAVKPYSEDNRNIVVNPKQDHFSIQLKSNPTTGYSWFLREYDANLITPKNRTYVPGNKKLVGSSGYEEWTFIVKKSGFIVPQQSAIRMVYARPWEDISKASQTIFHISTTAQ